MQRSPEAARNTEAQCGRDWHQISMSQPEREDGPMSPEAEARVFPGIQRFCGRLMELEGSLLAYPSATDTSQTNDGPWMVPAVT
ncbi:hypothetical protein NDU88_004863 [Pleurodeles waltl]|uniref:Uncharacterized protein n=1 Tax=Pleurodeles waltl TaxID=8319 RepID=A0AAV7LJE1_PLEWA|nr:hypothetical protein NDU88_004863 [Pleurodeles waltl]